MRYVIVGAGEAGLRGALALHQAGERDVTLFNGEALGTYERPALSKPSPEGVFHKPIAAELSGIKLQSGKKAIGIDRAAKRVLCDDGSEAPYDKLLLATGANPRRLSTAEHDSTLELRTVDDAKRIYEAAQPGGRAVVIGAGLIGLELAAELVRRELSVTVLEAGSRALARAVPSMLADMIVKRHVAAGVSFRFDCQISRISAGTVEIADKTTIEADLIIASIGVDPEVSLAAKAGLECANGIVTNAKLQTSDESIYAAGDCACVDHPVYGLRRFETWRNAVDQGTFAAKAMMGAEASFDAIPWFWSDQHDLSLQICGLADDRLSAVCREGTDGSIMLFYLDAEGRMVGAAGLAAGNTIGRDVRLAEIMIAARSAPDKSLLADTSVKLKSLLRS